MIEANTYAAQVIAMNRKSEYGINEEQMNKNFNTMCRIAFYCGLYVQKCMFAEETQLYGVISPNVAVPVRNINAIRGIKYMRASSIVRSR